MEQNYLNTCYYYIPCFPPRFEILVERLIYILTDYSRLFSSFLFPGFLVVLLLLSITSFLVRFKAFLCISVFY